MGRYDAGVAENKRALELDPLSALTSELLGYSLYFARRYDKAIEQMHQTIDMNPNHWFAFVIRGAAYRQTARLPESLAAFKKAGVLGEPIPYPVAELGRAYALSEIKPKPKG